MSQIVRLHSVTIDNYKSIEHGELEFTYPRRLHSSDSLGIYGPNGSGKSAVIEVLCVLRSLLVGSFVPSEVCEAIRVGADFAQLSFQFDIYDTDNAKSCQYPAKVFYAFKLRKVRVADPDNTFVDECFEPEVFDETLSISAASRKTVWFDTSKPNSICTAVKRQRLFGENAKKFVENLLRHRKKSQSLIFSSDVRLALLPDEAFSAFDLVGRLHQYGKQQLIVLTSGTPGIIYWPPGLAGIDTPYCILLAISGKYSIPEKYLDIAQAVLERINFVLTRIVPGLAIRIERLSTTTERGQKLAGIQLFSERGNIRIPLDRESAGIQKLAALIPLFVLLRTKTSVTVAIDDLDTHLFELCFGELVESITLAPRGQLIYTGHNLRGLETIDRTMLAFCTSDPAERFTRKTNVKETNNLRDMYIRQFIPRPYSDDPEPEIDFSTASLALIAAGYEKSEQKIFLYPDEEGESVDETTEK